MTLLSFTSLTYDSLIIYFSKEEQFLLRRETYMGETEFDAVREKYSEETMQKSLHYVKTEDVQSSLKDGKTIKAVFEAEL